MKGVYRDMMSEEKAVAIMMTNLKGAKTHKPSNLLEFAEACRTLKDEKGFGWGIKEMSRYFHVSGYMLRQIDKINEVKENPKLKKLIQQGELGIEDCYQLWRIKEPKRSQVAELVQNMTSDEVRRLVYFIVNNPKLSLTEIKKLFEKEKPEKIKLLVIPLDSVTYEDLKKFASHSKLNVHDFALKILENHMYGKKKK